MKLTRIELQDFRCFGEAAFDLVAGDGKPLDVVLLVGGNGSGKTAFLSALAGFFTGLVPSYGGEPLSGSDVRAGAERATIDVSFRDWVGSPVAHRSDLRIAAALDRETGKLRPTTPAADFAPWTTAALGAARRQTGTMVAFDIYRAVPPHKVVGPNAESLPSRRLDLALASTLFGDLRLRPRSQHLKQWIVNLDTLRARAKADRGDALPIWDTLRHALDSLLRPYTFEGVDDDFQVLFRTPTGSVPLEALSDGFRGVFVIIAELLYRLSLSTDHQEEVLQQEAVCFVDEIDAHLHPSWQENVLPALRELFPNVQLIATTHSREVVSSVEPVNVFRLEDRS